MGARDATSASTSVRSEARVSASRDGALPSDLLDASCSRRGDLRARGTRGEAPEPVHEDRAARVASSTRERAALEVKHRAVSRGRPRPESGLEHEASNAMHGVAVWRTSTVAERRELTALDDETEHARQVRGEARAPRPRSRAERDARSPRRLPRAGREAHGRVAWERETRRPPRRLCGWRRESARPVTRLSPRTCRTLRVHVEETCERAALEVKHRAVHEDRAARVASSTRVECNARSGRVAHEHRCRALRARSS
jgi:hypothetical protein